MTTNRAKAPAPGTLAITRQALRDMGFRSALLTGLVQSDPQDLIDEHIVIADFVKKRARCREGQETTLGIKPETWNLHTKTWRSVTWWDAGEDVCWLLATNQSHDYETFVARSARGVLLPTDSDRAELRRRRGLRDDFLDLAWDQVDHLLALAETKPGVEHSLILGDEIDMSLLQDRTKEGRKRLWLLYRVPPRGHKDLPGELANILCALFFPDEVNVHWHGRDHPGRPGGLARGEVVMHWVAPT